MQDVTLLFRYREKMSAIDRHRQNVQMRQAARVVRRFPQVSAGGGGGDAGVEAGVADAPPGVAGGPEGAVPPGGHRQAHALEEDQGPQHGSTRRADIEATRHHTTRRADIEATRHDF